MQLYIVLNGKIGCLYRDTSDMEWPCYILSIIIGSRNQSHFFHVFECLSQGLDQLQALEWLPVFVLDLHFMVNTLSDTRVSCITVTHCHHTAVLYSPAFYFLKLDNYVFMFYFQEPPVPFIFVTLHCALLWSQKSGIIYHSSSLIC